MKRFLSIFVFVIIFSVIAKAQTTADINQLLNRLEQNHSTALTDVFTPAELTVLRSHFDAQMNESVSYVADGAGLLVFGPENVNMNFGNFDNVSPGTYNILGASGTADFDGAGAYNPVSGTYFVTDNAGNVYDVNPNTGVYTFLGVTSPPAGENYVGMEFDPTDNQLYGLSTNGTGSSTLSTINTSNLSVSVKGDTGLTLGIALAYDLSGDAYAFDIDADLSYRIDKTNGAATLLGSIGYDANFGQGFALSRSTGNLYISAFNNTLFNSELRHFDTTTGNTTSLGLIGNVSPGGTLQFAWIGVWDSTLAITDSAFENFSYFPNPVEDYLMVEASSPISSIVIYNMLGQKIFEKQIDAVLSGLNLQALNTGPYIMEVLIGINRASYKLVKQ